ncbi:hypothetical protein F511_12706 [Dorcoceras hygrometricum]|uniref:Uncharacterized protein n=1 Tax=Dorcoceras hygrometricum TaxID=472368 RepID=A0A2Z7DFY8_9LAMI|nr:hypothetical protein F511_12706 [Dorcoceras hygrometricum]
MSTPSDSIVSSTAASVDSVPASPEVKEPWLPDQAELGSSSAPWYEEKSSNLRLSDISLIKEKGGMLDKLEVVLQHPDERAHRPPPDFHTFYVNQLDMGLRFPILRFITSLCQDIKVSPSQLAPNSYSFLLALTVLRYYNIPLIPYVLMQLVQIKRLWPGKFYLSHKGDHTFIKGNPSSHKRWMSRFFYVKQAGKKRNPWRCEMSWRDNIYTLTPSTPKSSPNLVSFLDAMRETSYNMPELIKEDLLCHFGFSRKGVELIGDLGITMSCSSHAITCTRACVLPELISNLPLILQSCPQRSGKKRKVSTPAEKEARRQNKKGASSSLT